MKFIIYSAIPESGVIRIPLMTECKCKIGISSIIMPNISRQRKNMRFSEVDIICDQVDSSLLNPKRMLQKICINKNDNPYTTIAFQSVSFFPIDSSDHEFTIRIKDQYGPIVIPSKINGELNGSLVTISLQIRPIEIENDRWIKYI